MLWPRYCENYEKFPVNFLQHDEAFTTVNESLFSVIVRYCHMASGMAPHYFFLFFRVTLFSSTFWTTRDHGCSPSPPPAPVHAIIFVTQMVPRFPLPVAPHFFFVEVSRGRHCCCCVETWNGMWNFRL